MINRRELLRGASVAAGAFNSPPANYQRDDKTASFWSLNGASSLRDKTLTLTVANTDVGRAYDAEIVVKGATLRAASVASLHDHDIHAHNTLANPGVVKQIRQQVKAQGDTLRYTFAPGSVTSLQIALQ